MRWVSLGIAALAAASFALVPALACVSSDFASGQFDCTGPGGACPPGQVCQPNKRCSTSARQEDSSDREALGEESEPESGIRCAVEGSHFCIPENQECCLSLSPTTLSCITLTGGAGLSGGDPCEGGATLDCDDPSDCEKGRLCCIDLAPASHELLGTSCKRDSCPVRAGDGGEDGGGDWLELCTLDGGSCKGGLTCKPLTDVAPSSLFASAWFYACQ